MNKRMCRLVFGLSVIGVLSLGGLPGTCSAAIVSLTEDAARGLHRDAVVIDTHNDTMMKVIDKTTWLPVNDIGDATSFHIDIPKMQQGGLDVPFFAAYTAPYLDAEKNVDYTLTNSRLLALINALQWTVRNHPTEIGLATSAGDVEALVKKGKIAAISSIEGAYSLQADTAGELLKQYYDLGVRAVALTHNYSNNLGEGINEKYIDGTPSQGGLTELGQNVVRDMNRLGIIVDVSHLDERTFWDVVKTANAPLLASHSGAAALKNHVRNLTDEQIKAIAQNGGVVQVVFWKALVAEGDQVTLQQVVDHIDHVAKLVGVDFVGLGSDYDGAAMPDELKDCSLLPGITVELAKRGYSEADIRKILGGNSLRVMKAVWSKADPRTNTGKGPRVIPMLTTGEIIPDASPVLTAKIQVMPGVTLLESSLKVIVDGIVYTPVYNKATQTVTLILPAPLTQNYHVVTFTAAGRDGQLTREARIFYVQ